jgi:hypothetical protein
MDQELLDSFKVKHLAGDANKASKEEIANWNEYLEAEGFDTATKYLGIPKGKKAKK